MRCDTCHKEVPEVSRVVVYVGYNRMAAKAIYNCPDCFAKKEQSKPYSHQTEEAPLPTMWDSPGWKLRGNRGTSPDKNVEEAASKAGS